MLLIQHGSCCGIAPETAAHLVLDCPELQGARRVLQLQQYPRALRTYQDFVQATARPQRAAGVVRWLLSTGRFPEFRLAERFRAEEEAEEAEER